MITEPLLMPNKNFQIMETNIGTILDIIFEAWLEFQTNN